MKKNQKRIVYEYMRDQGCITQAEASFLGVARLAARIKELKRLQIPIDTTLTTVRKKDGTTARIAVYRLNKSVDIFDQAE